MRNSQAVGSSAAVTPCIVLPRGTVNPVAGSYFNFSVPEPTGVVGIIAPEESSLLELPPGGVVLRQSRRALCGDKTVEVSRSVYRADRYVLWVPLRAPRRALTPRSGTAPEAQAQSPAQEHGQGDGTTADPAMSGVAT